MSTGYDFYATAPAAAPAPATFAAPTAVAPAAATPPPGWYADPNLPHQLRWFDGRQWTGHVSPVPAVQRNRALEAVLPVNRSALAIAAGYAGLFSILLVFAPIAVVLGVLALRDLAGRPTVGGRGRAWFGVVAGSLGTLGLVAAVLH